MNVVRLLGRSSGYSAMQCYAKYRCTCLPLCTVIPTTTTYVTYSFAHHNFTQLKSNGNLKNILYSTLCTGVRRFMVCDSDGDESIFSSTEKVEDSSRWLFTYYALQLTYTLHA